MQQRHDRGAIARDERARLKEPLGAAHFRIGLGSCIVLVDQATQAGRVVGKGLLDRGLLRRVTVLDRDRPQFLQQSAALSTITAYLTPEPITPLVAEESWQPVNVARGALRGLISFGQGLASIAIVTVVWAPVWLPLLLAGWWLRRRLIRPRAPAPTETA